MNANSSRLWRAALFTLLVCVSNVQRLGAQESDDEPTPVAATSDDGGSEINNGGSEIAPAADESESADPTEPGRLAEEPQSTGSEPAGSDEESAPGEVAAPAPMKLATEAPATSMKSEEPAEEGSADDADSTQPKTGDSSVSLQPAKSKLTIEAASFKGIQPGKSTSAELSAGWGPPNEIRKIQGRRVQSYRTDAFPKVTVTLASGVVTSIVVNLEKPMGAEDLAGQLSLSDVSSVQVNDDKGQMLGEAFPERGVLFGYAPKSKTPQVSQVVLEPIDAAPFLLRAESHLHTHYARCLADANAALDIDPKSVQAHGLRARVYLLAGDFSEALAAARTAAELEPQEVDWKLLIAQIAIETVDFQLAQEQIQAALDAKGAPPLAKAKAHALMGDCLALASIGDQQAMKHHQKAIRLAEPLVASNRVTVRRGAKEVLVDAHLGMAGDVGWGHWQQKSPSIAKWVERAETLAEDLVQHEQADEDLLLKVDLAALAALAGVSDPADVSSRTKNCLRRAGHLIEKSADPARTAQLEWQLGLGLSDASAIEQARGRFDKSFEHGRLALAHLAAGERAGRHSPNHDFLLGRVNYRIGVAAALGEHEHGLAVESYSRAVKLLETPVPPSRLADPGRHGEIFVSMAVSYWEQNKLDEALRLTKQGIKLMQQAVEEGLLGKTALAIPYGNLASMHSEIGDKQLAAEFAELAEKCEHTKR